MHKRLEAKEGRELKDGEIIVNEIDRCLPVPDQVSLLCELNHRINNEFASAISLISSAIMRTDNEIVKDALSDVVEMLHEFAGVHRALRMPGRNDVVNAATYLGTLCHSMHRAKLKRMGIKLVFEADAVWLGSVRCWRVALILYELVTNAARHAAGKDREVRVTLWRTPAVAKCTVSVRGAVATTITPARGLTIISDLAKNLGGQVDHSINNEGISFTLSLPFVGQEHPKSGSLHCAVSDASLREPQHALHPKLNSLMTGVLDEIIPTIPVGDDVSALMARIATSMVKVAKERPTSYHMLLATASAEMDAILKEASVKEPIALRRGLAPRERRCSRARPT